MNPFGPLLRFELVRLVRKRRLTLGRTLYALALAIPVVITYSRFTAKGDWFGVAPQSLAEVTQILFLSLFGVQALLACMLTPRWTADAITGEKERQTLPFLLLTDLSSREIILGKLASRLAQIFLFVLAGLPILVFLLFLGGIEPALALAGYAALTATLLSLGCLSVLCSVYARTTKAATQQFGRVVGLYVFMLIIGSGVFRAWPRLAALPGSLSQPSAVSVQDFYDLLNAGNPLAAGERVTGAWRFGGNVGDVLWPTLRDYLLFHLTVAAGCGVWAVRRLRPVAALQGDGLPLPSKRPLFKPVPRPPVGDRPVLWKALYFDFRQYRSAFGRAFVRIVFVLSFSPMVVALVIDYMLNDFRDAADIMHAVCRLGVTLALSGMWIIIAGQASASIGRERHKRTLDELLLTDLSTDEILTQKWWGSIGVVRWGLVWVAIHWLVAVLLGGLHILAVPVLMLEWALYATLTANLGLYFAARTYTVQQANGGTGLVGFGCAALPALLGLLVVAVRGASDSLFMLPVFASPPAALGLSAFSAQDLVKLQKDPSFWAPAIIGALAGLPVYGLLARRLWRGACWWFPRTVGRG